MKKNDELFHTPVGRLVQGDAFAANATDSKGEPLVYKSGANKGQPRVDYFCAVAFEKTSAEFGALYNQMTTVARQAFPHLFDATGQCLSPEFSFKLKDGDSVIPDKKGNKNCDKEGFKGCWILSFSNGFAPKVVTAGGVESLTNTDAVKRGYFVRIHGTVKGNGSTESPGIYLNHQIIELIAYGDEINSGIDVQSACAAPVGALPAGASAMPPAPNIAPAMPGVPAPAAPAPAMPGVPAPAAPAPAMPGIPTLGVPAPATPAPAMPGVPAPVTPSPSFLGAPAPPAPPTPPAKKYTVQGVPCTELELLSAGWTSAQIASLANDIPF